MGIREVVVMRVRVGVRGMEGGRISKLRQNLVVTGQQEFI